MSHRHCPVQVEKMILLIKNILGADSNPFLWSSCLNVVFLEETGYNCETVCALFVSHWAEESLLALNEKKMDVLKNARWECKQGAQLPKGAKIMCDTSTTFPCVIFILYDHWPWPYQSLQGGSGSTILILSWCVQFLVWALDSVVGADILSDKAWVQALGCRKNLETYTKYTHHILIFFILYVDKTLWNVPPAFLSNTFEQKFWIKRFTVTTFIIKTPLPSWHPNDTLKYVNAFEVSCSRLEYIYKC